MPKMKTKRAAAKRFQAACQRLDQARPRYEASYPFHRTTKNKRHLRGMVTVHESDIKSVKRMLPYA